MRSWFAYYSELDERHTWATKRSDRPKTHSRQVTLQHKFRSCLVFGNAYLLKPCLYSWVCEEEDHSAQIHQSKKETGIVYSVHHSVIVSNLNNWKVGKY